jgi:hypothetical protein
METTKPTIKAVFKMIYLAALEVFMARNDVRYYLNGICVKPCEEGGCMLIATDGHRMMIIRDKDGYASREFIIPNMPRAFSICRTKIPKRSKDLAVSPSTIVIDDSRLYIVNDSYNDNGPHANNIGEYEDHLHSAWPFKEIDGKFPDTERVIPRDLTESPDAAVSVNSKYLSDFHKAVERLCGKSHYTTTIIQRGKNSPLIMMVVAPGIEAFAIIMPMRNGAEENPAIPSWVFSKAEDQKAA